MPRALFGVLVIAAALSLFAAVSGNARRRRSCGAILRNGASALLLALPVLAAAGPAPAKGKITSFDVPNAPTTFAMSIGGDGSITGSYAGSAGPDQGFVRAPDGSITSFDPSGSTDTEAYGINDKGAVAGFYSGNSGMHTHGFILTP